jgi:hypothetical protein
MATMWDMPQLPGEDSSGFSALPPRQKQQPLAEREDPWRVQPAFGAARNRKLSSDPSFSVLVSQSCRCSPWRLLGCT